MWIMRYILRLSRQIAKRNMPYIYLSLIGLGHSIGQFSEFIWPYQETQKLTLAPSLLLSFLGFKDNCTTLTTRDHLEKTR